MHDKRASYRAFLLRFWQVRTDVSGTLAWRFSLEDPHTGERRGFAGLDALVACLQTEMSMPSAGAPDGEGPGAAPD